jgi:hypothetical protein
MMLLKHYHFISEKENHPIQSLQWGEEKNGQICMLSRLYTSKISNFWLLNEFPSTFNR